MSSLPKTLTHQDNKRNSIHKKLTRKELYYRYLKSAQWRNLRKQALIRDNYKCVLCGKVDKLEVHHLFYSNMIGEDDLAQLITLCGYCHAVKCHNNPRKAPLSEQEQRRLKKLRRLRKKNRPRPAGPVKIYNKEEIAEYERAQENNHAIPNNPGCSR